MESTHYYSRMLIGLKFLEIIFKNAQISNFMNIRSVGAELWPSGSTEGRTGVQTDMTKLTDAFRSFSNALKNKITSSFKHAA